MFFRETLKINTKKGLSFEDITKGISDIVEKSGVQNGLCSIFLPATTAGIMANENDRMLMEDIKRSFLTIDENKPYNHPSNAFSHLRANTCKAEITVPVEGCKMLLGRWQKILLWEFDTKDREREVIVTVFSVV